MKYKKDYIVRFFSFNNHKLVYKQSVLYTYYIIEMNFRTRHSGYYSLKIHRKISKRHLVLPNKMTSSTAQNNNYVVNECRNYIL